jgi:hypothetical protein
MKRAILTLDLTDDVYDWPECIHEAAWRASEYLSTLNYWTPRKYTLSDPQGKPLVTLEIVEVEG